MTATKVRSKRPPTPRMLGRSLVREISRTKTEIVVPYDDTRHVRFDVVHKYGESPIDGSQIYIGCDMTARVVDAKTGIAVSKPVRADSWLSSVDSADLVYTSRRLDVEVAPIRPFEDISEERIIRGLDGHNGTKRQYRTSILTRLGYLLGVYATPVHDTYPSQSEFGASIASITTQDEEILSKFKRFKALCNMTFFPEKAVHIEENLGTTLVQPPVKTIPTKEASASTNINFPLLVADVPQLVVLMLKAIFINGPQTRSQMATFAHERKYKSSFGSISAEVDYVFKHKWAPIFDAVTTDRPFLYTVNANELKRISLKTTDKPAGRAR